MKDLSHIYFVGAGGIGMAALERYFLAGGLKVGGYDRTPTPLTRDLEREGAVISYDDAMTAIPHEFRDPKSTLVIYTPAVPDENIPKIYFESHGFEMIKRSEALGRITRGTKALCFSGTHGKTTTSSMAAHIMHSGKIGCNAFLGGILRNYNSNLLLSATSPYSVVEADEYDRSFHRLTPYIAVVTATDPDHLDIYGTEEAYLESFAHFTELIRPDGILLIHTGLKLVPRPVEGVRTYTYAGEPAQGETPDFYARNVRTGGGEIVFDLVTPTHGVIENISLGVPVNINIENAVAAMAATLLTGDVTPEEARRAIGTFMGAERRFQFHVKGDPAAGGKVIIDDYAHHPDEIRSSISSVKALYPDCRLTVAFQPHLYSRTRDFAPQFAQALSLADDVVLLDIYPAREEPIPDVTSKIIFDEIKSPEKTLITKQELVETIKNRNFEVLLTLGAGDIVNYLPQLCALAH